jgi:hypothetical protein
MTNFEALDVVQLSFEESPFVIEVGEAESVQLGDPGVGGVTVTVVVQVAVSFVELVTVPV